MARPHLASELALSHPLFVDFHARTLATLLSRVREVHQRPGDLVYESGREATAVTVVLKGAMQIEYPQVGRARGPVTTMIVAPAVLGECQVLARRPWTGTGVALTDMVNLNFDRAGWLSLLDASPVIVRRLYLELSGRFLSAIENWRAAPQLGPEGLIARYFTALVAALERSGALTPNELDASQKAIAGATDLTRETVNRTLRAWADRGFVRLLKGRVVVVDGGALATLAGFGWENMVKTYWAPAE
jgi:CRP-like cAMP-binding protein